MLTGKTEKAKPFNCSFISIFSVSESSLKKNRMKKYTGEKSTVYDRWTNII